LFEVIDSPEIVLVSLDVDRRLLGDLIPLSDGKLDTQGFGDLLSDVRLDGEHVLNVPVIIMRPEMLLGRAVDQLNGDGNLRAGLADADIEYRVHAQLTSDLGNAFGGPFVVQHAGAGDDPQPPNF